MSRFVRWMVIVLLGLATVGMIVASMGLNYLYFASFGKTEATRYFFGGVSVAADLVKALMPVVIFELWRGRKLGVALVCVLVWIPCFAAAVSSALGLVASERMALIAERGVASANLADVERALTDKEAAKKSIRTHRPYQEVDAAIAAVLARQVGQRSVGNVSSDCTKDDRRTVEACAEVGGLRQELAAAKEAARLDVEITRLRSQVIALRERGGTQTADPFGEMVAFMTRGIVSAKDVGFWLPILIAGVIELVAAFGFTAIAAFTHVTRPPQTEPDVPRPVQARRGKAGQVEPPRDNNVIDAQPLGSVKAHIVERTEPAPETTATDIKELHADYEAWCAGKGMAAVSREEYRREFEDMLKSPELDGKIRKFSTRYFGIRLEGQSVARLPAKRRARA